LRRDTLVAFHKIEDRPTYGGFVRGKGTGGRTEANRLVAWVCSAIVTQMMGIRWRQEPKNRKKEHLH